MEPVARHSEKRCERSAVHAKRPRGAETARPMRMGAAGRRLRAIKWLANSAALNLPLAAHPCVGHIGLNGAVAEWLKAAVC